MKHTAFEAFKQYVRIASLIPVAWAFIGPVASVSAKSRSVKDRPVIRVGIYNYAEITRRKLLLAEGQAAIVFAEAGVRIVWQQGSCKRPRVPLQPGDAAPDLSVRILYASTITRASRISGVEVMGESIIPAGTDGPVAGGIANVYYDRVMEVSSVWSSVSDEVLGEAIAHELGHLMLGPRHSIMGVMKPSWKFRDLELIARRDLRFLPAQSVVLQRAARSLHQDSSPTLAAKN
jgi:hypothetical protein